MSDGMDGDSKCPPECGPGCWNNENNPNKCKTGPIAKVNKENCKRREGIWCADPNAEKSITENSDVIKLAVTYIGNDLLEYIQLQNLQQVFKRGLVNDVKSTGIEKLPFFQKIKKQIASAPSNPPLTDEVLNCRCIEGVFAFKPETMLDNIVLKQDQAFKLAERYDLAKEDGTGTFYQRLFITKLKD